MYIYIYGSDQVSAMHPQPHPPAFLQITFGEKGEKKKKKEMCNLVRACLYFEEDILNQNR